MIRKDYTQFLHEYVDDDGVARYAVARWDAKHGTYTRPLYAAERKANPGAFAIYGTLDYLGGYTTRAAALRAARRLFSY